MAEIDLLVQIVTLLGVGSILGGFLGAFYGPLVSDYLARRVMRKTLYRELVHIHGRAKAFQNHYESTTLTPEQKGFYLNFILQSLTTSNFYSHMQGDPERLKSFYLLDDSILIDKMYRNFQLPFRNEIEILYPDRKDELDALRCDLLDAAIKAFEGEVKESGGGENSLDRGTLKDVCAQAPYCQELLK